VTQSISDLNDKQIWDSAHAIRTGQRLNKEDLSDEAMSEIQKWTDAQPALPAIQTPTEPWRNTTASRPLNKMGHAKKHLKDFQKIDPSLTENEVAKILQHVKDTGKPSPSSFGSTNYESVVNIGGKSVNVKVNVSSGGGIKTGFPEY